MIANAYTLAAEKYAKLLDRMNDGSISKAEELATLELIAAIEILYPTLRRQRANGKSAGYPPAPTTRAIEAGLIFNAQRQGSIV